MTEFVACKQGFKTASRVLSGAVIINVTMMAIGAALTAALI